MTQDKFYGRIVQLSAASPFTAVGLTAGLGSVGAFSPALALLNSIPSAKEKAQALLSVFESAIRQEERAAEEQILRIATDPAAQPDLQQDREELLDVFLRVACRLGAFATARAIVPQLGHSFDSLIEFALALNKQRQIDQARGLLDYAAIKIDTLKNSDDADYRLSDLADAWAECGEPEKALRASLHLTNRRLQIGCLTRTAISAVVANRGHTLAESFFRLLVLEDVEFKPLARSGLAQLAATQGMSDLAVEILMSCSGVDPRGVIDALVAHDQWELALSLPNLLGLDTSDDNTSLALVRNHAERGRYQLATLTAEELKGDILRLKALLLAAEVILERGDAEESAKILNRAKCAGASIPMSSELETVLADYLTPLGRPSPISSQLVTPDFLDANYEIVQMLVPPERNRGATEHYRLAALALLIRKSVELHDRGRAERFLDEAETVAMLTGITNMCNIAALCYEIGQFEASDRLLERILRSATDANDERLNRIAAIMSGFGLQFENCSSARMTCEALLSGSTTSP